MKILISPNAFKGTLTAREAADAIESGLMKACQRYESIKLPLADGGDGMAEVMAFATRGKMIKAGTRDPLGRGITSSYAVAGDNKTAVIEMAAASGLALLKEKEHDPRLTHTAGTGELFLDALERGYRKFIIGLGGSATNDGGAGFLSAIGVLFLDSEGKPVQPAGINLHKIWSVDISGIDIRVYDSELVLATDVLNPLLGKKGATRVYAPQKGAGKDMVEELEEGMKSYARILEEFSDKKIADIPGSGAAGGFGAGLSAFLDVSWRKGFEVVAEYSGFTEKLGCCDLVITGEGKVDNQSFEGKVTGEVVSRARSAGKRVIVISGAAAELSPELQYEDVFSVAELIPDNKNLTASECLKESIIKIVQEEAIF